MTGTKYAGMHNYQKPDLCVWHERGLMAGKKSNTEVVQSLSLAPNRFFWYLVLFVFFMANSTSFGFAKETTVRIGVYENPPILFKDEGGEYKGLAAEVLEFIASKESWDLEYVSGTWAECLNRLGRGDIDIQAYIAYSDKRSKLYDFTTETLFSNWGQVFKQPDSDIESILDLNNKTVALLNRAIHNRAFKELIKKLNIKCNLVEVDRNKSVLELLDGKKVDAGVVNRVFGDTQAEKYKIKKTSIIFNPIEVRYAVPKDKNHDLVVAIDNHLSILKKDHGSLYFRLIANTFGPAGESDIPIWIKWMSVALIGIIFTIIFFIVLLKQQVKSKTEELDNKTRHLAKQIAERKQAEESLKKSNSLLSSVIESPDNIIIFVLDTDYNYLNFNMAHVREMKRVYDVDIEIGQHILTYIPREDDRLKAEENYKRVLQGERFVKIEEYGQTNNRFWYELIFNPIYDTAHHVTGFTCFVSDITKRKQLEGQLRQSQKLESIGNLAGGIAHDFNNILSSIIGFTELALDDATKGTPQEDNLQEVYTAGKRARDLVKQILAFARQSDEEQRPIQVNIIAKEVLKLIRSTVPTTIEIKEDIENHSLIMGNSSQVHQLFMNLCTNAAHAMEKTVGILEVGLTDVEHNDQAPLPLLGLKSGNYLKITVSDTGTGISPDIIDSIFEPYFTTKGAGEGTGMGLALTHGIVESYAGKITVDSELGKGTVFSIYLPITKKREDYQPYEKEKLPSGTERILFIDDELPIAKMGSQILEQLGYRVTVRTSSVEALELFRSKPNDFDLVISDMTMPNMTGDELAIELIAFRSDISIILCTGYSKKIDDEKAAKIGIKAFVYKPVVKADLATTVRKVLDEAKGSAHV